MSTLSQMQPVPHKASLQTQTGPGAPRYFESINFKTRFPALDGIRALAVTLVFLEHYGGGSHGGRIFNLINLLRLHFWVGVDLFFVLSGFLITGILFDTRHDSKFFKRFFLRRSVRIFPIFYFVLAVLLALTPFLHYRWHWGQLTFLVYLGNIFANRNWELYKLLTPVYPTFKVNLSHFWSLCVEEQFYMVWPVVVWLVRDRVKLLRTAAGIALLALALRCAIYYWAGREVAELWGFRTLPFRMDSLVIGGILALLLRGPNSDRWQRLCRPAFILGSLVTLAIFIFSPAGDSPWLLTIGLTSIAIGCAGLIGMTLRAGSPAFRLFYHKPLLVLGKYSYGFYVYHALYEWAWIMFLVYLMDRLHSMLLAGVIALGLNFVVTFLVSKYSYDLLEVRFLRLKRHFEYDSEKAEHKHAFTTR
jgi:peptidoglycan/LPS O-acetylase OafA/YrhL